MAKYKIKVNVELVECDDTINHEPTKNNDGSFSLTISGEHPQFLTEIESTQGIV